MGAALAVRDRQEDIRTMAHDALDAGLDQLEQDPSEPPTLLERPVHGDPSAVVRRRHKSTTSACASWGTPPPKTCSN